MDAKELLEQYKSGQRNFIGVTLRRADLECTNLRVADLRVADLRVADLRVADLEGADLEGANLEFANLEFANLRGANLRGANLSVIWDDLKSVLIPNIQEINHLYLSLRDGKIDGSTYQGECSCLSGTLAHGENDYNCLPQPIVDTRDLYRPIERFFFRIKPGDTIDNSWDCQQVFLQLKKIVAELKSVLSKDFIDSLDNELLS